MIPQTPPEVPGLDLSCIYVPCFELGGDFYYVFELPYDNVGLVIADDASLDAGFTRSEAERRLKQLCKAAGLPIPKTNARVAGHEVDAFWPAQKLIVEVDGWRYHRTRQAFERDRRKDAALTAAGNRVVRITWRRLTTEPLSLSAQFGALLAATPS